MKKIYKKSSPVLVAFGILLFIAGAADIKYRGLLFRALPASVQSYFIK